MFLPCHYVITCIHSAVLLVWAAVDTCQLVTHCLAEPCAQCVSARVCTLFGVCFVDVAGFTSTQRDIPSGGDRS